MSLLCVRFLDYFFTRGAAQRWAMSSWDGRTCSAMRRAECRQYLASTPMTGNLGKSGMLSVCPWLLVTSWAMFLRLSAL